MRFGHEALARRRRRDDDLTGWIDGLKRALRRWPTWAALALGGSVAGLASAVSQQTGYSGDRLLTRYGWPKPFAFSYLDETGRRVTEVTPLYLAGNAAFFAAVGLAALTGWWVLRTLLTKDAA